MKTFRTVHISLHETTRAAGRDPSGALAQLGERVLCKHEVTGSIPVGSTNLAVLSARIGVLGRTFAWAGNAGLGRACRAASVRRCGSEPSSGRFCRLRRTPCGCVAQVVRAYA